MDNLNKPVYNVKPVLEGGLLTAIAVIFALMNVYLPLVGSFTTFIWPIPVIILGVRHGYKWSVMAALSAGIIIALLVHPLQALSIVICFATTGVVIARGFRQGYTPMKILFFGAAASLLSKLAFLGIMMFITGVNPIEIHNQTMTASSSAMAELYRSLGIDGQTVQKAMDNMTQILAYTQIVLPSAFLILATADAYLNFYLSRIILSKLGHKGLLAFPPFKNWRMPRETVYFLAAAMLMIYWGQTRQITLLFNMGLNLQMIATVILLIQGVSLVYFLSAKYNFSSAKTGGILLVVLVTGILPQILIFAGIFDLLFDYRKLNKPQGG